MVIALDKDIDSQIEQHRQTMQALMQSIQINAIHLAAKAPGSIVFILVKEARANAKQTS